MRALGITQKDVLYHMSEHGGSWFDGCGWIWTNRSGTERIMRSLVRRGLVVMTNEARPFTPARRVYRLTPRGPMAAKEER